jgi:tetratricopeptide (TPR) repeat protein
MHKVTYLPALIALAVFLSGCSSAPREPAGFMDTPGHHFDMGLRLLDRGMTEKAGHEFGLALELDGSYPPALAGKGLVAAMSGNRDDALDLLDDARDEADDLDEDETPPELRAWPSVMGIRIWTELYMNGLADREELVEESDDLLNEASDIDPDSAAARYYAGEAHVSALDFARAEELFAEVLDIGRGYEQKAEQSWKLVQDVRRAAPQSPVGKRIALVDRISRADMAALLIGELDVARFYEATPSPSEQSSFVSPKARVSYFDSNPYDVKGHPLAASINEVLEFGVKGLEAFPDGSFGPDEHLTRAEAAMIYEDVLVRATGDWSLATKFIGRKSPFRDLRSDHAAFNAAVLATTRGFMSANPRTGRFNPGAPVSGVEALSSLQKLKAELRLFD